MALTDYYAYADAAMLLCLLLMLAYDDADEDADMRKI